MGLPLNLVAAAYYHYFVLGAGGGGGGGVWDFVRRPALGYCYAEGYVQDKAELWR